jgi:hypothetical protein
LYLAMDLERFLAKCRQGQWRLDELDWSVAPRPMARREEIAVVRYFTNMAGIERLAAALFAAQRRLTDDPVLREIFATFVADEERHAQAAERLAAFYDVHHFERYELSRELIAFRGPFLRAVERVSPEIANAYITGGELLLDVALLRSLDDYVADAMSRQVMELINRDESRHIAMDYFMMERYADAEYRRRQRARKSLVARLRSLLIVGEMLFYARPFLAAVFLDPMELLDPGGTRLKEAFKRMQYLALKPHLEQRPFARFIVTVRRAYNAPVIGALFGGLLSRIGGAPGKYLADLYTADEAARVRAMSVEELAEEALRAKELGRRAGAA